MPDEPTPDLVPTTTDTGEQPSPAAPATAPDAPAPQEPPSGAQAATPTWQEELEKADPKELRKHSKVAGIIGSEIQKAIQAERQRITAEEGSKAARQAEAELQRLAQSDPVAFAEKWLTDAQQRHIQQQLSDLRDQTRRDFATAIGRAFTDVPEWQEMGEADHEALAKAILGKSEDEVIPLFNKHALDLLAGKRVAKQLEQAKREAFEEGRKAGKQEAAAVALAASDAPDATRPKGLPAAEPGIDKMSDADFDNYWRRLKSRHR